MKNPNRLLFTFCSGAYIACGALTTHAQPAPWQTLYDGPGHVYTALLDPFSTPTQPSLFTGGMPNRSGGCSVQWIGPLDNMSPTATAACSDNNSSAVSMRLGFDGWTGSTGWLYSVGSDASGWMVRVSADEGQTWMTDSAAPPASGGFATGFAADDSGNVFVCGTSAGHWFVRQRDSMGRWTTIRELSARGKSYIPWGMHFTPGYLFVVGEVYEKNWVVERYDLAKHSWTTFNPAAPKGSGPSYGAWAVTSHGSDVYVLTWTGGIKESPLQTVLLKGTNLGAGTWTIFKTFKEGYYNRPEDLGFDRDGNLYVVGESFLQTSAGNAPEQWIVRRCDPVGNWQTWTPLTDDPATQRSFARQVSVVQTTGDVYIAGTAQDFVTLNWRTIVQKWAP